MTKDVQAVAAVVPLPRQALDAAELAARRQHLPRVDAAALRRDIDEVLDSGL